MGLVILALLTSPSRGAPPDAARIFPGSQVARFTTMDRAQRVRFRRAVALMVMTVLVPGSAQLVAGNRRVGRIAMRIWMALGAALLLSVVVSYFSHGFAFWAISNTLVLGLARLVLMALAIGWALLFMDAWRLGQPLGLQQRQRLAVVGVNGLLCFSVAGALLFGAHMVDVQRQFMLTMFGDGEVVGAHDGPLQRAAPRRRLRCRPLGTASRLAHRRQHRRAHGQDRAGRAAAQHGRTSPSPRGR